MLDVEGDSSLPLYLTPQLPVPNQEMAENIATKSTHGVEQVRRLESPPDLATDSEYFKSSQTSPIIGSLPRLAFQSNDSGDASNTSQIHNQAFKYDQLPHGSQLNPSISEPLHDKQGETGVVPDLGVIDSALNERPSGLFEWPWRKLRNRIKKLRRPSVPAGFQRIEWTCVSLSQTTFKVPL
jgi:hypothetical protein